MAGSDFVPEGAASKDLHDGVSPLMHEVDQFAATNIIAFPEYGRAAPHLAPQQIAHFMPYLCPMKQLR